VTDAVGCNTEIVPLLAIAEVASPVEAGIVTAVLVLTPEFNKPVELLVTVAPMVSEFPLPLLSMADAPVSSSRQYPNGDEAMTSVEYASAT
jgi:hypothetical protein